MEGTRTFGAVDNGGREASDQDEEVVWLAELRKMHSQETRRSTQFLSWKRIAFVYAPACLYLTR